MSDTKTKRPKPLTGSVDTSTDRERARLLEDDEVEALEAQRVEDEEDEEPA